MKKSIKQSQILIDFIFIKRLLIVSLIIFYIKQL